MTTYVVTGANYNSAAFWSSISEAGPGHTLDFSGLPPNFDVWIETDDNTLWIWDGTASYSVGEPGATGTNATLGAPTDLDFFTNIVGSNGDDYVESTPNADNLSGGAGNDTLSGGLGDDTIDGGTGNDELTGGSGSDSILGGDGNDTIRSDNMWFDPLDTPSDPGVTATTLTVQNDADGPIELWWIDETGNLQFDQQLLPGDNVSIATFEEYNWVLRDPDGFYLEYIQGTAGQTVIYGDEGLGDTVDGGAGNDLIDGMYGGDSLIGGSGDDTISGGTGADTMEGGTGADTFLLEDGFGSDTISGGELDAGTDRIDFAGVTSAVTVTYSGNEAGSATDGTDTLSFSGIEALRLSDQDDVVDASADASGVSIFGGGGDDTVVAGAGADALDGDTGSDAADYSASNAGVTINLGANTASGGYATGDTITHIEDLVGSNFNDVLTGYDGVYDGRGISNILDGGAGDDTIDGAGDADILKGGTGDDNITGGTGDDTILYASGDGNDTITDFNFGNTGTLADGNSGNNDFIDLSSFYDDIWELHADQADDGVLNQSNDGVGGVDYSDNASFGGGSLTFTGAAADNTFFTVENTGVICFAAGTLIRLAREDVPVEFLRPGDLVQTLDNGLQPVRWIGSRHLDAGDLTRHPKLRPVVISPELTGGTAPLTVSPQHGLLLKQEGAETLIRAAHLARLQGGRARVAKGRREVTYFHLMFDAHQIILANGAPAESFFPGPWALRALEPAPLREVLALFPEIAASGPRGYGALSREFAAYRTLPVSLGQLSPLPA